MCNHDCLDCIHPDCICDDAPRIGESIKDLPRSKQYRKHKEWYKNHPEASPKYHKKYYESHKAECNEKARKYYQEHREEILEKQRKRWAEKKKSLNEVAICS